jgi:TonB family protein
VSAEAPVAGHLIEDSVFRKILIGSAVAHLLLGVLLVVSSGWRGSVRPAPIFVDLVAPPRARPAPTPPVVAKPAPKPVEKAVVLKPKPTPAPKPAPKPEPKAPPRETAPVQEAAPSAAEVLAKLRQQVGPTPEAAPREVAKTGNGGGRFDPELAAYHRRVRTLLQNNWAGVAAFRGQEKLMARFSVDLDPRGNVRSLSREESSGNRFFDDSAERAIRRSAPFPSPPRGDITLDVVFEPKGVF